MNTSSEQRVVILADAHLPLDDRPGGAEQRNSFLRLIEATAPTTACYVLLGDIFDFWFEWKHVVPKHAFPLLFKLREITRRGTPVHYFAGNHDFHLRGFLRDEVGLTLHMDEWVADFDGRRYYFHHGDGLAASDVRYRRMKSVFRSRWAQWLFGTLVHPDLAMQIGRRTSDEGRRLDREEKRHIPDETEYLAAADRILSQGHDVVVIGHTHIAGNHLRPGGVYHNPGPFLEDRRYSVIEGDLPRSEVWA